MGQLDLGQSGLSSSWNGSNNSLEGSSSWGKQRSLVAQWCNWGAKVVWSKSTSQWSIATSISASKWSNGTSKWAIGSISQWKSLNFQRLDFQDLSGSWSRTLLTGIDFCMSSCMISLGSSNFSSVNWSNWELWVEDWCLTLKDWGNWQVGGLDTESQSIRLVVDGLELAVGVNVAVSALDKAKSSVAGLVLGRVDVAVSVSKVGELILRVELLGQWGSWGNSDGGDWSSSDGWGSNGGDWGTGVGKAGVDKAAQVWVDQDLGVGRGSQSG